MGKRPLSDRSTKLFLDLPTPPNFLAELDRTKNNPWKNPLWNSILKTVDHRNLKIQGFIFIDLFLSTLSLFFSYISDRFAANSRR